MLFRHLWALLPGTLRDIEDRALRGAQKPILEGGSPWREPWDLGVDPPGEGQGRFVDVWALVTEDAVEVLLWNGRQAWLLSLCPPLDGKRFSPDGVRGTISCCNAPGVFFRSERAKTARMSSDRVEIRGIGLEQVTAPLRTARHPRQRRCLYIAKARLKLYYRTHIGFFIN